MSVARFVVGDTELVVETNSRKRADTACALLEGSPAGSAVVRGERTHQSIEEMMAALPAAEDAGAEDASIPPEESAGFIRAMKERHYDAWADDPIPALGGLTPRQASQDRRKRAYRELDLLLRDMEGGEQRLPKAERYDFAALRERLGLPP